jgi:hypothetical protein
MHVHLLYTLKLLPESWGACTVIVDARRDTTFGLYEFD